MGELFFLVLILACHGGKIQRVTYLWCFSLEGLVLFFLCVDILQVASYKRHKKKSLPNYHTFLLLVDLCVYLATSMEYKNKEWYTFSEKSPFDWYFATSLSWRTNIKSHLPMILFCGGVGTILPLCWYFVMEDTY